MLYATIIVKTAAIVPIVHIITKGKINSWDVGSV